MVASANRSVSRRRALASRGFSLVELLVVIIIITLIVAIVVPSLAGVRSAGRRATTLQQGQNLNTSAALFQTDQRRVPGYFSAAQMGQRDNDTRGFTAMQNVLLDLAGGVQAPGTGSAQADWIAVGPGSQAKDQAFVSVNSIGSELGGKSYYQPPAKSFVAHDDPQKIAEDANAQLPDLVDSFGNPWLAWIEDESGPTTINTENDFARIDSSGPSRFYWNANAAFLKATSLGKGGQNQDALSILGGSVGDANRRTSLIGFLGNPGYPKDLKATPTLPAASRGKFLFHSAGKDGTYLSKEDAGAKLLESDRIFAYARYYSPTGPATTNPYKDSSGKASPIDLVQRFDDIIQVGGN